jgi:hypothetical protein
MIQGVVIKLVDKRLDPSVEEFIKYRLRLYKIAFSNSGEIVDTITPGLLKEGFLRLILRQDYEWDCERKNLKPNSFAFKKYLEDTLQRCYKTAKLIKDDDDLDKLKKLYKGDFIPWDMDYPKVYVCD